MNVILYRFINSVVAMKILLTSIICICAVISYSQTDNYERFKTGVFTYVDVPGNVEIIRTETTQTEILNNGKSKMILKITWENDSTYVLKLKKLVNMPGILRKGDVIVTTIYEADQNSYKYSYTASGGLTGTGEIIRLEK